MSAPTPPSRSSHQTTAVTFILAGVLILSVWMCSLWVVEPEPTSAPVEPQGLSRVPMVPADKRLIQSYISTGKALFPSKNEYGLEINSRDPITHKVNTMVTDCARAAEITKDINTQQMLSFTTCIDRKMGR